MTDAKVLPRQIVDLLRADYGDMVDFAIDTGRIVILEEKGVKRECASTA